MSERLTDGELRDIDKRIGEEEIHPTECRQMWAEIVDHRARDLGHAYNHCLDCNGPLVPCTCQPDCPGGMCGRQCHLEGRPVRLTAAEREALATLHAALSRCTWIEGAEWGDIKSALSVLSKLLSQGGGK